MFVGIWNCGTSIASGVDETRSWTRIYKKKHGLKNILGCCYSLRIKHYLDQTLGTIWWRRSRCATNILKWLIDYVKHNYFIFFIVCEATSFDLLNRSSSFLRYESKIYTHVASLTRNVRRPDYDRLRRSKHVASHTIKKWNSRAWRKLGSQHVFSIFDS